MIYQGKIAQNRPSEKRLFRFRRPVFPQGSQAAVADTPACSDGLAAYQSIPKQPKSQINTARLWDKKRKQHTIAVFMACVRLIGKDFSEPSAHLPKQNARQKAAERTLRSQIQKKTMGNTGLPAHRGNIPFPARQREGQCLCFSINREQIMKMKKLAVWMLSALLGSQVGAADWVYLDTDSDNEYKVYGDVSTRTANRAWIKHRYSKPTKLSYKNAYFSEMRILTEVDCKRQTFKPLSVTVYTQSGKFVDSEQAVPDSPAEDIAPDTISSVYADFICRHLPR